MDEQEKAALLVSKMTLAEKASLLSGKDFWHTKPIDRLNLPSANLCDGPHGLRKVKEGAKEGDLNSALPATCFPPACLSACSFDPDLLGEMGAAIAEEARFHGVGVVLGPGVNIKRSPLCGRNFEYFSEDPYLAGRLAAGYIAGMQTHGVGASLKHFALNSQETRRMKADSVADERAQREIYLPAFEYAVKAAEPATVMCSYNRVDGKYASENSRLLSDILRDEWGYSGLVVSDWGAVSDRVKALAAGLDLEMPPAPKYYNDQLLVKAVEEGLLPESAVDAAAARVAALALKAPALHRREFDLEGHHELARRIARESFVLLKNNGALPLAPGKLAVLGAFAEKVRYQGSGSSKINPTKLNQPLDALRADGYDVCYAPGYSLTVDAPDNALLQAAVEAAASCPQAVIFAGLPDSYESEGFDRDTLALPASHLRLIEEVTKVNPSVTVVLLCGAPVELPIAEKPGAILLGYLGGQAAAQALADVLSGRANPSGKLAESWPLSLSDTPSFPCFPGNPETVEYRESIFVGYRYYATADKPVRYPFGHGLSYTSFRYDNLTVSQPDDAGAVRVTCTVTNTGSCFGREAAQLYLSKIDPVMFRPALELKGFTKLHLEAGESKQAFFLLTRRDFSYYDAARGAWRVEEGDYQISVGASSADLRLSAPVAVAGEPGERGSEAYYHIAAGIPNGEAFAALLGKPLPPAERPKKAPVTIDTSLNEVRHLPTGRRLAKLIRLAAPLVMGGSEDNLRMVTASLMDTPLRNLSVMSSGMIPYTMMLRIVKRLQKQNAKQ